MWIKSLLQKAPTCEEWFSETGAWQWKNHIVDLKASFWKNNVSVHPDVVDWLKFYLEHRTGTHVYDFTGGPRDPLLGRDAGLMIPLKAYFDVWNLTEEVLPPKVELYHPKEALKKLKNNPVFVKNPSYFSELEHHYFSHVHESPIHRMRPYMMPFERDVYDWAKYLSIRERQFPWVFICHQKLENIPCLIVKEKPSPDEWFLFKPGRIKDPEGRIWKNEDADLQATIRYTKD